jgi:hypothetical protein
VEKPRHAIGLDFKAVTIEPVPCTIGSYGGDPNGHHLKSWVSEGSGDGVSGMNNDRRENNGGLNGWWKAKTFGISRFGSFGRIRVRQTGPSLEAHGS